LSAGELRPICVYSTCPPSGDTPPEQYHERVKEVARWSDACGCRGILVYTDNGLVDPWLMAQRIIQETEELTPLVAVQPAYRHPYSVAKLVTSLAHIHGRRVDLNMLAGGFRNDLLALGDATSHDDRYERTVEYTRIIQGLLRGDAPVTQDGRHYRVNRLKLRPALPPELYPTFLISGSSAAGMQAAKEIDAVAVLRRRSMPSPCATRCRRRSTRRPRPPSCLPESASASLPGPAPRRRGRSRASASPRIGAARSPIAWR
jgi:alkanesulfonate monooxygenase